MLCPRGRDLMQHLKNQGSGHLNLSKYAQEDAREDKGGTRGVRLDGRQIHLCPGAEESRRVPKFTLFCCVNGNCTEYKVENKLQFSK